MYIMTSFKPIKSRDCVDYIEIQYHSTSQYKGCMKVVSLNVTKPSIFDPLPEAKLAATPAE